MYIHTRASGIPILTSLRLSQKVSGPPHANPSAMHIICKMPPVSKMRTCPVLHSRPEVSSPLSAVTLKLQYAQAFHGIHAKRRRNDDHRPPPVCL